MSWFQNPFAAEFRGNLVLGDRQHSPEFVCPGNAGRGDEIVVAWQNGPYDLSGNDSSGNSSAILNIVYALDPDRFVAWTPLAINVTATAAAVAAVTVFEIVSALNADATFAAMFTATLDASTPQNRVLIKQKFPTTRMKYYIANGQAEETLRFNDRAGVVELPTYFARHTMANRNTFTDSVNMLVALDMAVAVDQAVVDNAKDPKGVTKGFSHLVVQADWQLLTGRSGIFTFKNITVDASDRITEVIEYPAGAGAGYLAKKTEYSYTGGNTNPDQITEIPYTLTAADLVTP